MAAQCWSSVGACIARVTKVDMCGRPLPPGTECAYAVTEGFTTVEFAPEISEGEQIEQRNACGKTCVSDRTCDEFLHFNVTITFCAVDPGIFSLITGYEAVLDYKGDEVGNRIGSNIDCDSGYALELWSRIPNKACDPDAADGQWGYFLLPWVSSGTIGDMTFQNEALNFSFTGRTKGGSSWGVGPWDVDQHDDAGTAGPLLTPITESDHLDLHLTTIAPPVPSCGCVEMPDYSIGDQS